MRWPWLLVALLSLGCDRLDAELPALSLKASAAGLDALRGESPSHEAETLAQDRKRAQTELLKLRARLTFSPPSGQPLPSCVGRLHPTDPTPLAFSFVDARATTKSLLPRRVSERLESGSIAELLGQNEELETKSAQELRTLAITLQAWDQRRYVGVFFIADYAGPALILRVGELKRSWYPGRLAAQFVLMDTVERQAVCGYPLQVQNDTEAAPIRSRLQADTRSRLERELANALVQAAGARLQRDLPGLQLPEALTSSPAPSGT